MLLVLVRGRARAEARQDGAVGRATERRIGCGRSARAVRLESEAPLSIRSGVLSEEFVEKELGESCLLDCRNSSNATPTGALLNDGASGDASIGANFASHHNSH